MASAPGLRPERVPTASRRRRRRNRAIADAYEPGSTFKIVTGSLAPGRPDSSRSTRSSTPATARSASPNTTIPEADHHRYGALTLAGIFEHSSNIGIIRVGLRLGGAAALRGSATRSASGEPTGVDLPGENAGIFRPLPRWSALSKASISMGQEVSLNALQLARITAVVANGGLLVQPHVVTRDRRARRARRGRCRRRSRVRVLSAETAPVDLRASSSASSSTARARRPRSRASPSPARPAPRRRPASAATRPGRHVPNFVGFAPGGQAALRRRRRPRGAAGQVLRGATSRRPLFSRVVSQALGILRVAPGSSGCRRPCSREACPSRPAVSPVASCPVSARRIGPALPPSRSAPADAADDRTPSAGGPFGAPGAGAVRAPRACSPRLQGTGFVVAQDPPAGRRSGRARAHALSRTSRGASRPRPGGARRRRLRLRRLREAAWSSPPSCRAPRSRRAARELEIAARPSDSRQVRPGDLFVAMRGAKSDGLAHVAEAIARGAVAVVSDARAPAGRRRPLDPGRAPRAGPWRSSPRALHGDPAEKLVLAGVTGHQRQDDDGDRCSRRSSRARFGERGLPRDDGYRTPPPRARRPTARRPRRR